MADAMDHDGAAIEVRGLVKDFPPDVRAVDHLDLRVERGECFGLLGPNGAGKTTTIEILEGLQRPTSGEVFVLGSSWNTSAASLRRRIGIQLQETELYAKLSVAETVTMFRSFYDRKLAVDEILASVDLTDKRNAWVEKLSGGQKQRLAIACALVSEPELVFLDEPTTGLDPAARRALWDIIRGLRGRGRTVVLTTHYMEEAEKLCDRIAIVNRGKVIALGTPRELIARLGSDEIIELDTEPSLQAAQLANVRGVVACHTDGSGLRLAVKEIHVALPSVLDAVKAAGARPSRLTTRSATLDDVFVELTGKTIGEAEQNGGKPA
jgi:ABC-2 type transport system ATP-binding protein